ncbi:putative metallophosphoesterase YunD [Heyndrickxia sporothermodurans]|nr:putative metallophosphoesterase YunD [Heyndrickxia sporothermodurans]
MIENIHIYHTNDIHSHFENWPRIRDFLMSKKKEHKEKDEAVFLFDIGDHVDRWHPYSEGTVGKGNVHLLNEVGYTAATIGNNEGITLAHDDLENLYTEAEFDVIVANLYGQKNMRPNWVTPYKIYQLKNGVKIGVTAVTANFKHLYKLLEWNLEEPFQELNQQIEQMKNKVDILILLSHLGIHDDRKIAKMHPEIDIILGGHTHHILEKGEYIQHSQSTTLLGAAGKHGNFVGHIHLKFDYKEKTVREKEAILFETKNFPAPFKEKEEIANFHEKGKKLLYQKVVSIPETLSTYWFKKSELPQVLCKAIQEWCHADCAFINAGLVLDHLNKGIVTKYDLHQILPHPINPCLILLDGKELESVLLQTLDPKWPILELKGLGFRGKILGNFIYENISMDNKAVYINGKKLNPNKIYKLGTVDMYTFGHFFPELFKAEKKYFMPEFLRDVLEWKLKKKYEKE